MIFMKKYFFAFTALVLAVVFSSFTKPFTNVIFKLKTGVDKTSAAAVENKANWEEGIITCAGNADIPCTLSVDPSFTSIVNGDRVLNTSGSTITIVTENGFLDTAPDPDVQYKRVASGTNYSFVNKVH
jgi:hypothetical protein